MTTLQVYTHIAGPALLATLGCALIAARRWLFKFALVLLALGAIFLAAVWPRAK